MVESKILHCVRSNGRKGGEEKSEEDSDALYAHFLYVIRHGRSGGNNHIMVAQAIYGDLGINMNVSSFGVKIRRNALKKNQRGYLANNLVLESECRRRIKHPPRILSPTESFPHHHLFSRIDHDENLLPTYRSLPRTFQSCHEHHTTNNATINATANNHYHQRCRPNLSPSPHLHHTYHVVRPRSTPPAKSHVTRCEKWIAMICQPLESAACGDHGMGGQNRLTSRSKWAILIYFFSNWRDIIQVPPPSPRIHHQHLSLPGPAASASPINTYRKHNNQPGGGININIMASIQIQQQQQQQHQPPSTLLTLLDTHHQTILPITFQSQCNYR
jgi:hypothetical protein